MNRKAKRLSDNPAWRYAFTGSLAMVMSVAIFSNPGLGILARFIIDDLGLTRTELGLVATVTSLSGALLGPYAGTHADRIGARTMLIMVVSICGIGFLIISAAPTLAFLFVGALIIGVGQSGANPGTNKLIGLHIPPGRRGLATGIKQSGVQAAAFFGGIVMPAVALAWSWRVAIALMPIVAAATLLAVLIIVPADPLIPQRTGTRAGLPAAPQGIKWIAANGLLNGVIVAAVVVYLPLYAEESIGMAVRTAGLVASAFAVSGLLSRITWAHFADSAQHFSKPLLLIAAISTAGLVLLWLAEAGGSWLLWAGAVILATSQAFNSVAFLAVISSVDQHDAGRASGIVARGFGIGLAAGPPLFGFTVDTTGGYGLGFGILTGFGLAATALMVLWGRRDRGRTGKGLT